jgi:hypothetical protein
MDKQQRPSIVSIAGWYLTVTGILGYLTMALPVILMPAYREAVEATGNSVAFVFVWKLLYTTLITVSGIGVLGGRNWSRVLLPLVLITNVALGYLLYGSFTSYHSAGQQSGLELRRILDVLSFLVLLIPPASRFFSLQTKMQSDQ